MPNGKSVVRSHGDDAVRLVPLEEINAFHMVMETCSDTFTDGFVKVEDVMERAFPGDLNNYGNLVGGGRTRWFLD